MNRTQLQKNSSETGKCVIYVMSRDQRVSQNHALLYAIKEAESKKLPIYVVFFYYSKVKSRGYRHYKFMFEGLSEVSENLKTLNIPFLFFDHNKLVELNKLNPESVYFDFSPLRGPRAVKSNFSETTAASVKVVDTHNIIPVWVISDKEEFAAYTIRSKIHKQIKRYLDEDFPGFSKLEKVDVPKIDAEVFPTSEYFEKLLVSFPKEGLYKPEFIGGYKNARNQLELFIDEKLKDYDELRNDPTKNNQSDLSPYLHFGQISSLEIVKELLKLSNSSLENILKKESLSKEEQSISAFIEELVVRKELSDNFCYYNENYDSIKGVKPWAKATLLEHQSDKREYIYSQEELEFAKTYDPAWNAAQIQMIQTGKMHGYMRMYWCKKILEWTKSPEEAVDIAVYLNDKYSLDGYDPNGYVGILWSIGGVHDRQWFDRPIFGKVRYMNYGGLKRKFDIKKYETKFASLR